MDIFTDYKYRNKPIEDNTLNELSLLGDGWEFAGFYGSLSIAKIMKKEYDCKTAIKEVSAVTTKYRFWALFTLNAE